jgi:RNA polymerase sigma-70 factor (ECF subfamily)
MWRTDEELMLAFANGDELAFENLYYRYEKPILNFINRILMNSTEAETYCQETFFRVVRAKNKYEPKASFKTWIYQIALNLCRDRKRRMRHRSHLSLDSQAPLHADENLSLRDTVRDSSVNIEKQMEKHIMHGFVKKALAGLSPDEHFVITMKEYQGLKLVEISQIMNCPLGTIKSHCHRAHKKLAKALALYMEE